MSIPNLILIGMLYVVMGLQQRQLRLAFESLQYLSDAIESINKTNESITHILGGDR